MKNRILILATMFIGAFALLAFTVPQEKKKKVDHGKFLPNTKTWKIHIKVMPHWINMANSCTANTAVHVMEMKEKAMALKPEILILMQVILLTQPGRNP